MSLSKFKKNNIEEAIDVSIQFNISSRSFLLVPIGKWILSYEFLVKCVNFNRHYHNNFYIEMVKIDIDKTNQYLLSQSIYNISNIHFILFERNFNILTYSGVVGLKSEGSIYELDLILKTWRENSTKGLFVEAVNQMTKAMHKILDFNYLELKVLESNLRAIKFYEKIGFSKNRIIVRNSINVLIMSKQT